MLYDDGVRSWLKFMEQALYLGNTCHTVTKLSWMVHLDIFMLHM